MKATVTYAMPKPAPVAEKVPRVARLWPWHTTSRACRSGGGEVDGGARPLRRVSRAPSPKSWIC